MQASTKGIAMLHRAQRLFGVLTIFLGIGSLAIADETATEGTVPVAASRIYTCEPGKLDALHARFRDHTMRIFAKHGIENVAYWTPVEGPTSENTLVYLLKHKSRDAARASWDAFRNDPEWKDVAAASRKAHGKILAKAPEATYLELTDYSPAVGAPDAEKVFELRTYTSPEGKLSELHDRFRKYTDDLFQKHGMTSYGYWAPTDPPASGNVMIYLLEHSSRDAARDSWKAFLSDPEWKEVARKTQENGPLLSKRPDAVFLKLTDYSPRR